MEGPCYRSKETYCMPKETYPKDLLASHGVATHGVAMMWRVPNVCQKRSIYAYSAPSEISNGYNWSCNAV